MSNSLSLDELTDIQQTLEHCSKSLLLKRHAAWAHFNTDDILIRYRIDNNKRTLDRVSKECPIPKKFKIVYIDENYCPWVKNVNVKRGLGSKLYCLTDSVHFIYETDPDQTDCLILGATYDPRSQYRLWRTENPDYGKQKDN